MWAETDYSFEGEFFSMPSRNVLPKPFTRPHPPLWVAAGNPGTFETAAKLGLGVLCFGISNPAALKPLIELYKTNIGDAEPVGGYVNDNVMVTTQMLCLDDGPRAKQIATEMTSRYHTSQLFRYLDTFPRPDGIPAWPAVLPEPTLEEIEAAVERGLMAVGSPEEVERCVAKYQETGADQLVFGMLSTTMPIDVAIEAVETFGRELIPAYDEEPEHRTTAQREAQVAAQPA
jgi:alkanesulfonate monooxygenase SsuD/methylene tetrahydromethanopterin reductase-like flavin-dependent oxidoreductase (luciferase family)